jgi:uncharacterized membrane protein
MRATFTKGRLEAFSDGVLAIIITIMVLEMKVPHGPALADLGPLLPRFLSYVLSFIYVGIYWANHHHMMHAAERVTGGVLWANLNLLLWLSLIPLSTEWIGEHPRAAGPTAVYGAVLFMSGVAYWVLERTLVRAQGQRSVLARAVRRDLKGTLSIALYLIAIGVAFASPVAAKGVYVLVALLWLVPDRRIERALATGGGEGKP